MRKTRALLVAVLLSLGPFVPLAMAQGTYTQVDFPGALATYAFDIDSAGDVVGYYQDASQNSHGFLLSGGTFSTIEEPNSDTSYTFGINDNGQIVGAHRIVGGSIFYGFVYDVATGAFTDFSYPESHFTLATAINNAGVVVGYASVPNGSRFIGFELNGGTFLTIQPHAIGSVSVNGINDSGDVVGYVFPHPPASSFVFNITYHRILGSVEGAQAYGINNANAISGTYFPGRIAEAGFVYDHGSLQELQFPAATTTLGFGINDLGQVTGAFFDQSNAVHGFLWTPPADAAEK